MSRNSIILVVVLVVIVAILIALSRMNTEVPATRIETPVTLQPANTAAPAP